MNIISSYHSRFVEQIPRFLPKKSNHIGELFNAIEYCLDSNGKCLRPILVYACAESFKIDLDKADVLAFAIECIHTYSLIHDDLPAMDDDDLRRGKPSCHRQFDEATAILAGDGLNTYAFELLSKEVGNSTNDALVRLKQIQILANSAGIFGMVGGQDTDLTIENNQNMFDKNENSIMLSVLENLHINKTAKLITACLLMPYLASSDYKDETANELRILSEQIGLYYQIQDDILDVTQTSAVLGKPNGSDSANNKITYTSLLGIDNAILSAEKMKYKIDNQLKLLNLEKSPLNEVINFIANRNH